MRERVSGGGDFAARSCGLSDTHLDKSSRKISWLSFFFSSCSNGEYHLEMRVIPVRFCSGKSGSLLRARRTSCASGGRPPAEISEGSQSSPLPTTLICLACPLARRK